MKTRVTAKMKPTHYVPSGMGGVFPVFVTETREVINDIEHVMVVVACKAKDSDFQGYTFFEPVANLEPMSDKDKSYYL